MLLPSQAPSNNGVDRYRSPKLHATVIGKKHAAVIGQKIEDQDATLSGLLAVAKKAGLGGLASWVKSAKERSTFKDTTESYQQLNGIF